MKYIEIFSNQTTKIELSNCLYVIGRNGLCDIQINDDAVSRYHASLFPCQDGFAIMAGNIAMLELGQYPVNGLYLNGIKLAPDKAYVVAHGDLIRLTNKTKIIYYNEREEKTSDATISQERELCFT